MLRLAREPQARVHPLGGGEALGVAAPAGVTERPATRATGALMGIRVQVVDPSAFTPPYDHALSAALARAGARVQLLTSEFAYGSVPPADGYEVRLSFYRHAVGAPGSRVRQATKLIEHVPDMLHYRRLARAADVTHFQWLDVQWLDSLLLPRGAKVLTAHDLLPREPRPGQARAQRRLYDAVDALVVHSEYGRGQLVAGPVARAGQGARDPSRRVRAPHPAASSSNRCRAQLQAVEVPVVLFFGLLRPYKGLETLLQAWREVRDAELWIVGRPRMPLEPLRALAGSGVRFIPRFVSDAELPAFFRRADVVVLPYTRTERFDIVRRAGNRPGVRQAHRPQRHRWLWRSRGRPARRRLVAPDDAAALHRALSDLIGDPVQRRRLAAAASAAASGPYSWDAAAARTLELYHSLCESDRGRASLR